MVAKKKARNSKGPRLVPQDRLMSRFYEPLVLLHILDRTGRRILCCPSEDPVAPQQQVRDLRRDFSIQLAYVCDYIKGGDSVTAIALESRPPSVIYWVASNTEVSEGTIKFLRGILKTLRDITPAGPETSSAVIEKEIAQRCIDFSLKRVKCYEGSMRRVLQQCLASLRGSDESEDRNLARWLERFGKFQNDLRGLCNFAYQESHSPYMRELQRHIGDEPAEIDDEPTESEKAESRRQAFLLTRHYIGRLGSHFRAARTLVAAGSRMPYLFEDFDIKTRPSPKAPTSPPPTDHLTTLDGIIKRMLPASSEDTARYQELLKTMDAKFHIEDRLHAQYKDAGFRPRVHAELILLEHFYAERLPFFENDRFIACSKPACYCCYHYISVHPGGFVRPPSHGIRYLAWRPPDLVNAADVREKNHQRDVMNKVIVQIRLDTLQQIEQRKGPSPWHPDSTTGITSSKEHAQEHTQEQTVSMKGMVSQASSDYYESEKSDDGSDTEGGVSL